jgi:cephalosporin hydroxylase
MNQAHDLIGDRDLKIAASDYLGEVAARANEHALGIFDKWFLRAASLFATFEREKPWEESVGEEMARSPAKADGLAWDFVRLRLFLDRWRQGRFVAYHDRLRSAVHYATKYGTEFGSDVLLTCQGASTGLRWRGLPLMKTAFDIAIYPQLMAELHPRSIFEIGSGTGASAMWLADQAELVSPGCHVHSVDRARVALTHPGVSFHAGDCACPESLFEEALLAAAPHPWLVIEDAHHNVAAVLGHFHAFLEPGDYLYVEDSDIKRNDIKAFLAGREDCYAVDTKYTDLFGRNATCALDSILVRRDRSAADARQEAAACEAPASRSLGGISHHAGR